MARCHELGWPDIELQIDTLVNKIKKNGFKFDKIATVTRGGLVLARLVADKFDIKVILVDKKKIPEKPLFVDDIYDTGNTFNRILPLIEHPKKFLYATLVARKGVSYPKQLVYGQSTKGNEYVVFSWDSLEHERKKKLLKP
ncbi:MAG: phosphoribosyltransferase [Nitrosotalea sp.]